MFKTNCKVKQMHTNMRKSVLFLFFIIVPSILSGQVVLTNPGIPEKETIVYTQDTEGKLETVKAITEYKSSGNESWLEYKFYSKERDVLLKLNDSNLTQQIKNDI